MKHINKVFGIGMSKTGTTTLAACLETLGFLPHSGFEPQLKRWLEQGKDIERILTFAQDYRSFEDSPWYHLYTELDKRFPGSKFILTVRKDSETHAQSSWAHGLAKGTRSGEITDEYRKKKIAVYEKHNNQVLDYFRARPDDLLVMCWEKGDGWEKLCPFLGMPVLSVPIPHRNQGRYQSILPETLASSSAYKALVRAAYSVSANSLVRRIRKAARL